MLELVVEADPVHPLKDFVELTVAENRPAAADALRRGVNGVGHATIMTPIGGGSTDVDSSQDQKEVPRMAHTISNAPATMNAPPGLMPRWASDNSPRPSKGAPSNA